MAEEFVSLFDTIGLRTFSIVSHDWGTAIADFIAGNHPDRILGYVRMQAASSGSRIAGISANWSSPAP